MSLIDILPPPTEENAALLLHPGDHVAVARVALAAGQTIRPGGIPVVLKRSEERRGGKECRSRW